MQGGYVLDQKYNTATDSYQIVPKSKQMLLVLLSTIINIYYIVFVSVTLQNSVLHECFGTA